MRRMLLARLSLTELLVAFSLVSDRLCVGSLRRPCRSSQGIFERDEYYDVDMTLQADCLRSALQQLDSIYVARAADERFCSFVEHCASDTTSVMLYNDQIPNLAPDVTLFVHWRDYWRTHSDESAVLDTF